MHRRRGFLVAAAALSSLFAGCGSSLVIGKRTGPDFAEAFPDPTVLVTTTDIAGTHRALVQAWLPETDEHHEMLERMLAERESISAGHLQLLVEAVSLPDDKFTVMEDDVIYRYAERGSGYFAGVVDRLLLAGIAKLDSVDRAQLGGLLARTQSDETMAAIADALLADVDDGSDEAIVEVLRAMHGSPARDPLLYGYLLPRGQLEGSRGWAVVQMFSFDSARVKMVRALAGRMASVDSGRLLATLELMSFDDGRAACVEALLGRLASVSADDAHRIVGTFSFDSGREAALARLAGSGKLRVGHDRLVEIVGLFSFDSGRVDAVRALREHLQGSASEASARSLLAAMSFDSGRSSVVRLMADVWRELPADALDRVTAEFSFDSGRKQARERLR